MDQLIEIFNNCTTEGFNLFPPTRETMEIPPKVYADFKKVMVQNLGKWKGGNSNYFKFPFDPTDLLGKLRNGEKPNYKQEWHYFPTPEEVISEMYNTHIPWGDIKALEPSAGRGAIIEGVNEGMGNCANITWDAIEMEPTNRGILKEKGINLIWDDFDIFETDERYDVIYANPPFKRDFAHVDKILGLLVKGGSAVIVLPSSFESKYQKHIRVWEENFEHISFRNLDKGSFKQSGTGVDTVIMYAFARK